MILVKGTQFKNRPGSLKQIHFRDWDRVSVFPSCINLSSSHRNGFQKCENLRFSNGGSLYIYIYIYIQYYFPIKTKIIINLTIKFKDETQLMEIVNVHVDVDHAMFAKKFEHELNNFG